MSETNKNFGSFRDPSGFVFESGESVFRTINESYRVHYEKWISSGLAKNLVEKGWIPPFHEEETPLAQSWKTLCVERIPFISYPYEWSFKQLKEAAILTLRLHLESLRSGMILKDASAYNVQFFKGKPVFIDLLSFETYKEGMPWIAYRQYISHFLGPLLLMSRNDSRQLLQMRNFLDGLPVDYISNSLPWKTWFSPSILLNIHWHAKLLKKHADTKSEHEKAVRPISLSAHINMIEGLLDLTRNIKDSVRETEWGDYYNDTNYDDASFKRKGELIHQICSEIQPKIICDLGANLGEFSRIFAKHAEVVLSPDIDPVAVNKNYTLVRKNKETNIYPLVQDLCNPSPAIGWMNEERKSFIERAKCDLAAGLALIHHLCIGNNLPLDYVARFFYALAPNVIVEFVPREDSQVKRLLSSREDIFPDYHLEGCIESFAKYYGQWEQFPIEGTTRTILFFSKRLD